MDHQDYKEICIGNGGKSKVPPKKIVPKNHVDLHAIKLENETENFKNKITYFLKCVHMIPKPLLPNFVLNCNFHRKYRDWEKDF